jgi:S-DNA-T family DNA segregation ATPase FtsK/SpoIIIE
VGWRARLPLARGQTITDVTARIAALESGLGTHRNAIRVHPTPDDLANRCELRVLDRDPHADAITWSGPSVSSVTEPIDLGPFEDAEPCRVLFLRRHAIFGGTTGAGKSGGLNVLMGNLTACRDVVIWAIDLKKGMELQPWSSCIGRLATTPEEATVLLRDAAAIMQARAAWLAAHGRRTWEPTPEWPALVILIDEYAELTDQAPDAITYTDSIARLGRAVAVTLVAATQRPTQKAMGQGAVRSMVDLRICFRVRERRDVDLILGQGMLNSGWSAHRLNAPGKFLVSAPEHDTPRRARAYFLTDKAVTDTAAHHAPCGPELDQVSRQAIGQADPPEPARAPSDLNADDRRHDTPARAEDQQREDPEVILWAALSLAPDEGMSVPDLVTITGMGRRWIYYRLKALAATGRVVQTARGRWRIATEADHRG